MSTTLQFQVGQCFMIDAIDPSGAIRFHMIPPPFNPIGPFVLGAGFGIVVAIGILWAAYGIAMNRRAQQSGGNDANVG